VFEEGEPTPKRPAGKENEKGREVGGSEHERLRFGIRIKRVKQRQKIRIRRCMNERDKIHSKSPLSEKERVKH
jgi:hypothetical protein